MGDRAGRPYIAAIQAEKSKALMPSAFGEHCQRTCMLVPVLCARPMGFGGRALVPKHTTAFYAEVKACFAHCG